MSNMEFKDIGKQELIEITVKLDTIIDFIGARFGVCTFNYFFGEEQFNELVIERKFIYGDFYEASQRISYSPEDLFEIVKLMLEEDEIQIDAEKCWCDIDLDRKILIGVKVIVEENL
jgi:hypothetical protein